MSVVVNCEKSKIGMLFDKLSEAFLGNYFVLSYSEGFYGRAINFEQKWVNLLALETYIL